MSFVESQIHQIDARLDRIEVAALGPAVQYQSTTRGPGDEDVGQRRVKKLHSLIKSLSPVTSPQNLTPLSYAAKRLLDTLDQAETSTPVISVSGDRATSTYKQDLEWLLLSKISIQTYGLVLNELVTQATALSDNILYWDDVLSSFPSIGLYYVQTSPLRLWDLTTKAWSRSLVRHRNITDDGWSRYWKIVISAVDVLTSNTVNDLRKKVMDPLARARHEAMAKRSQLQAKRDVLGIALGTLLADGFVNDVLHSDGFRFVTNVRSGENSPHTWKVTVAKSVGWMDAVLYGIIEPETEPTRFLQILSGEKHSERYFSRSETDDGEWIALNVSPAELSSRIRTLLQERLPNMVSFSEKNITEHGRPPRIVRYWLPATMLLVSSTTMIRIITNRKAELVTWLRELGATIMDFWSNWVIEPTRKVIGTIRHDEASEVSIMSKKSLEGDRASLERMVVDFAMDNPEGPALSDSQIAEIRAKVREGDVTPVLKAYERDLRRPLIGTVRGNLIRTLLIQVQKTKVDIEVAMGGIDSLLKSQELVFGLVGLTPGLLISFGVLRWLQSTLSNRKGLRRGRKKGHMLRLLRNIDRILTSAKLWKVSDKTDDDERPECISYKDHGLLLCEINVLQQSAGKILPNQTFREFATDVDQLTDIKIGVVRQQRVADRLRWAYAKWV